MTAFLLRSTKIVLRSIMLVRQLDLVNISRCREQHPEPRRSGRPARARRAGGGELPHNSSMSGDAASTAAVPSAGGGKKENGGGGRWRWLIGAAALIVLVLALAPSAREAAQ